MSDQIIRWAVPFFLTAILAEKFIGLRTNRNVYRFPDTYSDLGCGVVQQIFGLAVKLYFVALYNHVHVNFSFASHLGWPVMPATVWGWAAAFVIVDFWYYWFHRLSHGVNFLWAAHVVHHQSEEYNMAVALRQGAIQNVFNFLFFLPMAILGLPTEMLIVCYSVNLIYQFWIHTQLVGKLGFLELFLNTPSHHRVHHGVNPKYIDRNHAGVFIVWDRWFRSFQEEDEAVVYGITTPVRSWNPLWTLVQPFVALYQESARTKSWRDKIAVWFMDPGWKPADLGGRAIPRPITPAEQTKYGVDEAISSKIYYYVLAQFLIILALSLALEPMLRQGRVVSAGLLAVFVLSGLGSLAGLLEKKSWVRVVEPFRHGILALVPLAYWWA